MNRSDLALYAVTDRSWLGGKNLVQQVEEALKGGITMLQLREKELDYDSFLNEAVQIKKLCNKYNVPFLINDNVDIAIECGADGVHVGQSDMDALNVREKLGNEKIIGVSAQTVDQAIKAQESGADYLGVGAVFSTSTKKDAQEVTFDTLKSICNSVSIPVVAIGGISKNNISLLTGSGIAGAAVVSAIFAQPDITSACLELLELSKQL